MSRVPYIQVEYEVDMILKKKDVVKHAAQDWVGKWLPTITNYVITLKGKVGKVCKDTLVVFAGEYDLYVCMHVPIKY